MVNPRSLLLSLLLPLALGLSGQAAADVGPAPRCPTGLQSAYLYGRYCAPVTCTTDADCGGGASCAERSFCLAPRTPDTPDAIAWQGNCEGGATCSQGATCSRARYCGGPVAAQPSQPASAGGDPPAQPSQPASAGGDPAAPPPSASTLADQAPARSRRNDCAVSTSGSSVARTSSSAFALALALALLWLGRRRSARIAD